jgi:chromosome partitioning protein
MNSPAQCISFANFKGGTGKTTTCVNLAGYLAQMGAKVLVVDFDPQANATSALGIDGTTIQHSIYDAFLNCIDGYDGVPITQIILETPIENLHLAPSALSLGVAPMLGSLTKVKDKTGILKQILNPVLSFYDCILIDVPSDTGLFMLNSLRAADRVVVPLDPSIFSLDALANLELYCQDLQEQTGHEIQELIVILNRAIVSQVQAKTSGKRSPTEEISLKLQELPNPVFFVPQSLLVYRSQIEGIPLSHYPAYTGKIGKAYEAIAEYLAFQMAVKIAATKSKPAVAG